MNGENSEVDTFASDVFMSKLGSLLSVTCRHCSMHPVRTDIRSNLWSRVDLDQARATLSGYGPDSNSSIEQGAR